MPVLMFSYFDSVIGPVPFIIIPEKGIYSKESELLQNVASHMDNHKENEIFEIYYGELNLNVLNLIFSVNSDWARGMRELVMCSILEEGNDHLFETYKSQLEFLRDLLIEIPVVYKALYINSFSKLQSFPEIMDIHQQLVELIKKFQVCIPMLQTKEHTPKIAVFGRPSSGRHFIVSKLRELSEYGGAKNAQDLNVLKLAIRSMQFLIYNPIEPIPHAEKLIDFYTNSDIILFVVNRADTETVSDAKEVLREVTSRMDVNQVPIAIIINKTDKGDSNDNDVPLVSQDTQEFAEVLNPNISVFDLSENEQETFDTLVHWLIASLPDIGPLDPNK